MCACHVVNIAKHPQAYKHAYGQITTSAILIMSSVVGGGLKQTDILQQDIKANAVLVGCFITCQMLQKVAQIGLFQMSVWNSGMVL